MVLEFGAAANHSYGLLWNALPLASGWNRLLDIPALPADRLVTLTNSTLEAPYRFFRLVSPALP